MPKPKVPLVFGVFDVFHRHSCLAGDIPGHTVLPENITLLPLRSLYFSFQLQEFQSFQSSSFPSRNEPVRHRIQNTLFLFIITSSFNSVLATFYLYFLKFSQLLSNCIFLSCHFMAAFLDSLEFNFRFFYIFLKYFECRLQ